MSEFTVIEAPTVNVNDDTITIINHVVEDGARVGAGQPIYDAETSKMAFTISSPKAGFVRLLIPEGEDADVGSPIAYVADSLEVLPAAESKGTLSTTSPTPSVSGSFGMRTDLEALVQSVGLPEQDELSDGATVTHWLVSDGAEIEQGQPLFRVQSGKKSFEIQSPLDGRVRFLVSPPAYVSSSGRVCVVGNSASLLESYVASSGAKVGGDKRAASPTETGLDRSRFSRAPRPSPTGGPIFSKKAGVLVEETGLEVSKLPLKGLVRARDILLHLNVQAPAASHGKAPEPAKSAETTARKTEAAPINVPHARKRLPKAKRYEAQMLSATYDAIVPSQVTALVPTKGVFQLCRNRPFLNGMMSSRIIFELSRLTKKYPLINSTFRDGDLIQYEECNVGYALDAEGRGLKVPVIQHADRLSLPEIHRKKQDLMVKYVENTLAADDLMNGTFTITDLSGTGSWVFNPVLNANQSAILGIGDEQTTLSAESFYPLMLAFDHRVTEGLYATQFLQDLKERLVAHEESLFELADGSKGDQPTLRCSVCQRDHAKIRRDGNWLLKTVGENGVERLVCTLCAEGW